MSETEKYCTSCKKNLNITEFTLEGKIFKTCNICKQQKMENVENILVKKLVLIWLNTRQGDGHLHLKLSQLVIQRL